MPDKPNHLRKLVNRNDSLKPLHPVEHMADLFGDDTYDPENIALVTNRTGQPVPVSQHVVTQLLEAKRSPKIRPITKVDPGVTGKGTVIAILDTGVSDHDALRGKIIKRIDTAGRDIPAEDAHGHGTHMAGIIAADDTGLMKGLAPGARIVSVKITTDDYDNAPVWRITRGLEQILIYNESARKADRVSAVLICYNATDNVNKPIDVSHHKLARHIAQLHQMNIPVICSSGNMFQVHQQKFGLAYPAYIPKMIVSAALTNMPGDGDRDYYVSSSQRINPENSALDVYYVAAPGYRTLSTGNQSHDGYSWHTGTSQAAAVVAGTVLLLQSEWMAEHDGELPTVDYIGKKLIHTP